MKILVINPGSTSTKFAVSDGKEQLFSKTIRHTKEELDRFETIPDQKYFRFDNIKDALAESGLSLDDIDAVASRGGIVKPIESGTYDINEALVADLKGPRAGLHASCLAGLIGYELKQQYHIPAFIVDPVVVDELADVARLTGIPNVERVSIFHALNQKAISRECAHDMNKEYEECNFVVAHMGGGISVAAHQKGRVVDVNNAIGGDGPFSPERSGTVASLTIAELIANETFSKDDIKKLATGKGGLTAYLGTNDLREVERMIDDKDDYAMLIFEGMAYQIAKEIGAMAAVLKGEIDAIILTGGLAYSKRFTEIITEYVRFAAPVKLYPGEFEMEALASAVLRVLKGEEESKVYI